MIEENVVAWLREAPFSDPNLQRLRPDFDYEEWFRRGRTMSAAVDTLIAYLEQEDLKHPSADAMRAAYALGWIADDGQRASTALVRILGSKDVSVRSEAASALGRLRSTGALPLLERLLNDTDENVNVRANACIAIGRMRVASSEPLLRRMLGDTQQFLVSCA